jgi:hypothetical protein
MEMRGITKEAIHKSLSLEMLVGGWKPSCRREVFEPRKLELNQKACSLDAIESDNICKMFLVPNPTLLEMGCISIGTSQGQGRFSSNGIH